MLSSAFSNFMVSFAYSRKRVRQKREREILWLSTRAALYCSCQWHSFALFFGFSATFFCSLGHLNVISVLPFAFSKAPMWLNRRFIAKLGVQHSYWLKTWVTDLLVSIAWIGSITPVTSVSQSLLTFVLSACSENNNNNSRSYNEGFGV